MSQPEPQRSQSPVRWPSVRQPGQVYKVAQRRDVGTIPSDAGDIHWQTESFGDLPVNPGVVEFRKAEADHRQETVCARRGHGPRRKMPLPTALRYFIELHPIVLVPLRSPLSWRIRVRRISSNLLMQMASQTGKEICSSVSRGKPFGGFHIAQFISQAVQGIGTMDTDL